MQAGTPLPPGTEPADPAAPARPLLPFVYLFALAVPLGIAPAQIALGLGLLVLVASLALRRQPWTPSAVDPALLGFLTAAIVSATFAAQPLAALDRALGFWTLLPFLLAREASSDLRSARRLLQWLLAGAVLAAGMGVAEGLFSDGAGFSSFLDRIDVPDPALRGSRVTGFFSHPMTFAGQQAILLTTFAALGAWGFPGDRPANGVRRWALRTLPLALMALALVFTGGRAAFAAAAVMLGLLCVACRGRSSRAVAVLALVALLVSFLLGGSVLAERLGLLGSEPEGVARTEMWHAALGMLRERPLLGIGPGMYRHEIESWIDVSIYHPAHAHSTPFQVAAETGLFGLAAWIAIWAAFFGALTPRAWRMVRREDPRAGVLVASWMAVAVFLLIGLLECNLGDGEVAMLLFFLAGIPFGRAFYGKPPA